VISFLLAFPSISYKYSSSPHACYMPYPSHPPWRVHYDYTWRRMQFTKLLFMEFSPTSRHFIPPPSRYSPQHPVLKHLQSMFLP
jgi:hypothetical protein